MTQPAVVEEAVVAQVEIPELLERRQGVARNARLLQSQFQKSRRVTRLIENGVFHRDVGLYGLTQNELFELRGLGEQGKRVSDERRGLAIPEAAVQVELFQVRQFGNTGQLFFKGGGAEGDPDQIERADAEFGDGKLIKLGDRPVLSLEHHSSAQPQCPLGDESV